MIIFCNKCVTPNTRPRVVFNENGVCNACINNDEKNNSVDWIKREKEFLEIIERIKQNSSDQQYNCIVPWSGGKDSTFIALKLKYEFNLKPLLVTFSPLIPNEIGVFNRELLLKNGFDSILFRPNQKVAQKLSKRFFIERGNPKVAWDAGINSIPVKIAMNYKVKNIFYAEHGESEYGGLVLDEESKKSRNLREVVEHIIGDFPENWVSENINLDDVKTYMYPNDEDLISRGITSHYFAYYFKWSINENYKYVKKVLPEFKENEYGRTEGTFTNFDSLDDKIDDLYYYMQFIKFGFGRATRDASRFIMNKEMTRNEAIDVVRKYDGEFPKKNLEHVLKFLNLNKAEFEKIVDKHRNDELWEKKNNKWNLKNKL